VRRFRYRFRGYGRAAHLFSSPSGARGPRLMAAAGTLPRYGAFHPFLDFSFLLASASFSFFSVFVDILLSFTFSLYFFFTFFIYFIL
jgi:hypothetical protein